LRRDVRNERNREAFFARSLERVVLVVALALVVQSPPLDRRSAAFDDHTFCEQMRVIAARDEARAGTVIDHGITHGGIAVDCLHRLVDMRTMLERPPPKSWLRTQQRPWVDEICSEPDVGDAVANGWKVTASVVEDGKVIALF
jgi:hypothetical protein